MQLTKTVYNVVVCEDKLYEINLSLQTTTLYTVQQSEKAFCLRLEKWTLK